MRSTVAEINLSQLRKNLAAVRERAGDVSVCGMVKANAYGHGIVECSRILEQEGVDFLGVAYACEGEILRRAGIKIPILVLTPAEPYEAELYVENNLEFVACNKDVVKAYSEAAAAKNISLNAHLHIDTGMHRDGIFPQEIEDFMSYAKNFPNIIFTGICTHFATADEANKSYAMLQLDRFNHSLNLLNAIDYKFKYIHAANTAAVTDIPGARFNLIRPGFSLYGYNPSAEMHNPLDIEPIMTLHTHIIGIRKIAAGESVSYARRYYAEKPTQIVSLPVGYGDGYIRQFSNNSFVLIRGKRYPVVGAVCMDQMMVDVGEDDVAIGDDVVLIGRQGKEKIFADELAARIKTIPYEITTLISARVPRIFIEE